MIAKGPFKAPITRVWMALKEMLEIGLGLGSHESQ